MQKAMYIYNNYHMIQRVTVCDSRCDICNLRFRCWTSKNKHSDLTSNEYDQYLETRT